MKSNLKSPRSFTRIILSRYKKKSKKNITDLFCGFGNVAKAAMGQVLDPAEYFVCDDRKVIYLVNSKVACSSIKSAMMSFDGDSRLTENYKDIHDLSNVKGMSRQNMNIQNCQGYFIFTFVRDPFSRLVSLYKNKFSRREIYYNGFHFDNYLGGLIEPYYTFEQFVKLVSKIPDEMSDRHFKSQKFLIFKESPRIDYVGKMENLKSDYANISKKYSLGELPHLNKSIPVNISEYYDKKILDLVSSRYQSDIELFDYSGIYDLILRKL